MIKSIKTSNRIISAIIAFVLVLSVIPQMVFSSTAVSTEVRMISDPSTIDQWKDYFPISGDINTKNAGGVWTDKSVFTEATTIDSQTFNINNDSNFLVALSAIGSNMSITGQAAAPTDTVLVLDMSSSMSGNVASLAKATNIAMKALYKSNPNNRVSIVTYSANNENATKIFLPLDTYTATGDYLTSDNNILSVARGVKNAKGNTVSGSVTLSRGTYIQGGIAKAKEVLDSRTVVENRIPVVVLMTDGEPTIGSTNIVNPNGDLGFGVGGVYGGDVYNFATQLSLAYLKQEAYKNMLLYTVGVGIDNSDSVLDILNPSEPLRTRSLTNYWETYNQGTVGATLNIGNNSFKKVSELNYNYVSKIDNGNTNGYFSASSNNLDTELSAAFSAVVAEIVKSSVYSPTLIQSAGHELSGYISFVDKIGSYMQVDELKGIVYGGQLFTGNKIAEAFYEAYKGSTNGDLGNMSDPTSLGYAFMRSIESRLGIDNAKAWEVMRNAWQKGQIYYNAQTAEYSNWFGWVSTSAGVYIQPWYEGMVLPTNAGYINRSYIYLGKSGDTDMMYSTVRIREKVVNGVPTDEQYVDFAVPASLIPTITYEVTLGENDALKNINVITDTPIHLVYEVGLNPEINKFNIRDKVSAEYIEANTDADGNIMFYTNEWERSADADGNVTGKDKSNAYAYFNPAQRNDRYYYQNDSLAYIKTSSGFEPYISTTVAPVQSNTDCYYYYTYYAREGNSYKTVGEYHIIPNDVLAVAAENGDGKWLIKKGTIRSDYSGNTANVILKDDPTTATAGDGNKTETLPISHEPFADSNSHLWNDTTHNSVVGVTMANNGRISISPETGIRLTKSLATDIVSDTEFVFDVAYSEQNGDLEAYAYRFVNGVLVGEEEAVAFVDGKATVKLKAGETLYIGGMTSGEVTVTEQSTQNYAVKTVSVNQSPQATDAANVELLDGTMIEIDYVNAVRGTGTYTVAKEITHNYNADYVIPNNEFTTFKVELSFSFDGNPLAGEYKVAHADGNESSVTLKGTEGEKVTVYLHNNDRYTVYGLPEGTVVKAEEILTATQQTAFTPSFYQSISEVIVEENEIASVIIVNAYQAQSVSTSIDVQGTKNLIGNNYYGDFTFMLQKYTGSGGYFDDASWTTLDTRTASYSNENGMKDFAFDYDWSNEIFTTIGTSIYRVHENRPFIDGMVYDSRIHTFQIDVTDTDMDGNLEIAVITNRTPQVIITEQETTPQWKVSVDFSNEFTNNHTAYTAIDIQKAINNPTESHLGSNLSGFKFGLYDSENVLIEELTTNSVGAVRFSKTYTADDVGTYTYYLKEIAPNPIPTNWQYDNSVVEITVEVSLSEDNLCSARIITDADNAVVNTEGNELAVTFTNSYTPDEAVLDIDFVNKEMISNVDTRKLEEGEFEFAIYQLDENGNRKATPVAIGTNNADGKVTFTPSFTYEKVGGPYFYDIVELKPESAPDYITYDMTVYRVSVYVTDENGKLEARYVLENTANDTITFSNKYIAQPAKLTISGNKTISGRNLTENDFQFILTNTVTNEALYTSNAESGTNTSAFVFPEITYYEAGTYTYTVREYNPTEEFERFYDGVIYDNTVFEVTVTVLDNEEGQLTASYTVNGSNGDISFQNAYTPTPVDVQIEGFKAMHGRNILETDEFTFELFDASFNLDTRTWTKGEKISEAICLTDGSFAFDLGSFDTAGKHTYLVTEKAGNAGGVTYDTGLWYVLVDVTDNGNGTLISGVYYINGDTVQDRMVFTNIYEPSDGYIIINGNKVLNGRPLTDQEFTFELYEATDESFDIIGDPVKTTNNNETGEFEFKLDYSKEDAGKTFYYVAKEENAGLTFDSVTYSDVEYNITVTVEDNYDGTLNITKLITVGDVETDVLEFTNKYSPTTSVNIDITKIVENLGSEEIIPEGFEFVLKKENSNEVITVISDKNGDANISLVFTEADVGNVYTYKLSEVGGVLENMTYDSTVYTFTIAISLVDYELAATIEIGENKVDEIKAKFVNIYDYTPPTDKEPLTPATGDYFNLGIWLTLIAISSVGIMGMLLSKKRKA